MAKLAISESFLQAYSALPKAQQKKVREFMEKFRADPTRASIHLEPIHATVDDKVRTPTTAGAPATEDASTVPPGRLFAGRTRDELARCGVPAALVPAVWGLRTESDLDQLHPHLPAEVSDVLYALASGMALDDALAVAGASKAPDARVDTTDIGQALEHPDSQRRFYVVESERELIDVLAAPLARWRVFLHPSQRALVARDASGPVRVLGGAGTGKTVVAMHLARHLAAKVCTAPGERVLFTTFTKNLARDIRRHLKDLCGDEFARIDVDNLHHWAAGFLRVHGVKVNIAQTAAQREYLKARRVGRGTPLSREQRAAVWRVLARYRAALDTKGLMENADVIREARLYLAHHPEETPYRAVVVDETQNLRPDDLDGGEDDLAGYHSLRQGPAPVVRHLAREAEEAQAVLETLRVWRAQGADREVCLAARTTGLLESRYLPLLKGAGIPAVMVDTHAEADLGDGVRLATMHRVKGLEFPRMLLAGVQEGTAPLGLDDSALPDAVAREDHALQERRLLFVAATRARDELVVTPPKAGVFWADVLAR